MNLCSKTCNVIVDISTSTNGENLRGLELHWIFENDVKGDLDISEGTQGPNRKKYVLLRGKNFGKGRGELFQNFRKNNMKRNLHKANLRRPFSLK